MDVRKHPALNLGLYALALAGTIAGELYEQRMIVWLCKPLLMVVLSSWFFFNSRRVGDRFTLLVQAGLFFSLIGDVALMFQHLDAFNFLIGLGAFLIAHLCYAIAFVQNVTETAPSRRPWLPVVLAVGVVLFAAVLLSVLLPRTDEVLRLPVFIYACAISFMAITAAFRFGRTFRRSFILILAGAMLFITSDALLAMDRFHHPLDHARWSVMLTYGLAQALIVVGALMHVLGPETNRWPDARPSG
jgi:uncharacterized membrane protein YhhN